MVSQLIAKMVEDGDDSSAEDAETVIQNVAMVAVEGMRWYTRIPVVHVSSLLNIPAASDTVQSRRY